MVLVEILRRCSSPRNKRWEWVKNFIALEATLKDWISSSHSECTRRKHSSAYTGEFSMGAPAPERYPTFRWKKKKNNLGIPVFYNVTESHASETD